MEADDRTRTDNLLITNQLLCQLSHIGAQLISVYLTLIGNMLPNDSYGNRTRVTAVKGRCLNRLTKEPDSPCWTRTNDTAVNSRMLYRLS